MKYAILWECIWNLTWAWKNSYPFAYPRFSHLECRHLLSSANLFPQVEKIFPKLETPTFSSFQFALLLGSNLFFFSMYLLVILLWVLCLLQSVLLRVNRFHPEFFFSKVVPLFFNNFSFVYLMTSKCSSVSVLTSQSCSYPFET